MINSIKKIVFLTLILFSFFSCNKDNNNTPYSSLDDFFLKQANPETFTVNSSEDIVIDAREGTKIFIPSAAVSHVNGPITVKFQEFFKKSDLVLNNLPTNTTQGKWLESGGSFFFEMKDSGGETIIPSENLTLNFPVSEDISNPDNMDVWNGSNPETNNFGIWTSARESLVELDATLNEYNLSWPAFRWINCDYVFESQAPQVKVTAKMTNTQLNAEDIVCFIVFKNINAVVALSQNNRDFESFDIPVGEEAHILMVGLGDDFHLKILPFTVAPDQHFDIEMDKVLEEELTAEVQLLD